MITVLYELNFIEKIESVFVSEFLTTNVMIKKQDFCFIELRTFTDDYS